MAGNLPKELDKTDMKILELLQVNCKMSIAKIAKEVGKGISAVHSRIKALESAKVITQYTAVLDPAKMGRSVLAIILITIRYRIPGKDDVLSQREFCREIAHHPLVQDVHVLSGEFDVLLKVRARSIDEMNGFIVDFLRGIPAVDKTLTMFTMDSYLETLELRDLPRWTT